MEAIREVSAKAVGQHSSADARDEIIVPMLDALGFDQRHRRVAFVPVTQLVVSAEEQDMALVVPNAPGNHNDDLLANIIGTETQFPGRIVVTDGVNWSVYQHHSELPDLRFDLAEQAAFWDLFIIGQANQTPADRGDEFIECADCGKNLPVPNVTYGSSSV